MKRENSNFHKSSLWVVVLISIFFMLACSPQVAKNNVLKSGVWQFDSEAHDPHYYAIYRNTTLSIYPDSTASFLMEEGKLNAFEMYEGTYLFHKDTVQLNASKKIGFNKNFTGITELCEDTLVVFKFICLDENKADGIDSLVGIDFLRIRPNRNKIPILLRTKKQAERVALANFEIENDRCIVPPPSPPPKLPSQIKLEAEVDSLMKNRKERFQSCLHALKAHCYSNVATAIPIYLEVTREGRFKSFRLVDIKKYMHTEENRACVESFFEKNDFHFGEIKIVPSNRRRLTETSNYLQVIPLE